MSSLTRYERETVIIFNEEESTATITTANPKWKRRLNELCSKCVGVHKTFENEIFSGYTLPKKLLSVRKPKDITNENRVKMVLALERAREKKQQSC